jgi:hypothetical protein
MKKFLATVATSIGMLVSNPGMAQNIVPNPDFDAELSGWTLILAPSGGGSISLDTAVGSPIAPSMYVVGGGTPSTLVVSGCLPISQQIVDLQGDLNYVQGATPIAAGSLEVSSYGDTSCASYLDVAVTNTCFALPSAGWQRCSRLGYLLPAGTQAVTVALRVNYLGGNVAHFDNVRLGPAGTVPVTLQSFGVE